ncbi:MAG: bifunctional riboflavin kinase/FAD synthetase [Bacteroidales bacterium]|nr:bifunctional riboflavin kinase/FAD synthetase [Bacteroidales bacterium]
MREVAVVTTGFFDGVHLGHRHVLETVVSSARERGEEAIVVTFWPHPRTVLQQDARDFRLLTSVEEKKALLKELGIDRVEVIPFTKEFARLRADEYLRFLRKSFGATMVVMGYDNRIGSDQLTADACAQLPEFAHRIDFSVLSCAPLPDYAHGEAVSSTQIRKAIEEGDVERANKMLGYDYPLHGVVVSGNKLGRTIGFPTANMQLYEPLKLLPKDGVYAVEVEIQGQDRNYRGMCNIGVRPTVDGKARTIETHILDFDEDIYGLPIRIKFKKRIRDEIKFESLDALRQQLALDRQKV